MKRWSSQTIARYLARKRPVAGPSVAQSAWARRASLPLPTTTASTVPAAEPTARAFPIDGFPADVNSTSVLEALLGQMTGVTRAYVSPITAVAYVDYLPEHVTEEHLVEAMERGGYQVGPVARRFTWRQPYPR